MMSMSWIAIMSLMLSACGVAVREQKHSHVQLSPLGSDYADRCTESETQNRAQPVLAVSGEPTKMFRSVAQIGFSDGETCSAVLIRADRLVTAAHCFESQRSISSIAFKDRNEVMVDVKGATVRVHPKYQARLDAGEDLRSTPELVNYDVAIIELKKQVNDREPIEWAAEFDSSRGKLVAIVGYGDTGLGAGNRRLAYSHVGSRLEQSRIGASQFDQVLALDSASATGACPGDSGGGIFVKQQGGYRLAAVISGINDVIYPRLPLDECDCPQGVGVGPLIAAHADFIEQE